MPNSTIGQRISRAKTTIAEARIDLDVAEAEFETRVRSVLRVLYLVFNEGYASSGGESLIRVDLCAEAVRLTRMVYSRLPDHAETVALLGLELLHEARRPARLRDGDPVPLDEQDRSLWNPALIAEGTALADAAMARGPLGPFQLQAAVAALHCGAASAADTDWLQILALYDLLVRCDPSPMVPVSRAVAVARVHGPAVGLRALDEAARSPPLRAPTGSRWSGLTCSRNSATSPVPERHTATPPARPARNRSVDTFSPVPHASTSSRPRARAPACPRAPSDPGSLRVPDVASSGSLPASPQS